MWRRFILAAGLLVGCTGQAQATDLVTVTRLADGPIIHPQLDPSIGVNIQGPSVIRVPAWLENPLGKYYLYFADHKGRYIRLAYADAVTGPWKIHVPGTLRIEDSYFLTSQPAVSAEQRLQYETYFAGTGEQFPHDRMIDLTVPHIASPDVHVDDAKQRIVMYYHGLDELASQVSRVAVSSDGINFVARPEILGRTYWRGFDWQGQRYGLAMPGQFYRSDDPLSGFVKGPLLFNPKMRHCAVMLRNNELWVFWTQAGDAPEHIKLSTLQLSGDWMDWQQVDHGEVLRPEKSWEGADAPVVASMRSTAYGVVNELRDPAILLDDGKIYLFYAVAGESGIAVAELTLGSP
jgi:hypothetical protein